MRIARILRDYLKTVSDITDIVGKKVYLRRAPAAARFPYITISLAGVEYIARSNAPRADASALDVKAHVQIDSWSSGEISVTAEDDLDELAEAVAKTIDDFSGTLGGITVKKIRHVGERDSVLPLQDGSDEYIHHITQDYEAKYLEPTT